MIQIYAILFSQMKSLCPYHIIVEKFKSKRCWRQNEVDASQIRVPSSIPLLATSSYLWLKTLRLLALLKPNRQEEPIFEDSSRKGQLDSNRLLGPANRPANLAVQERQRRLQVRELNLAKQYPRRYVMWFIREHYHKWTRFVEIYRDSHQERQQRQ